MKEDDTLSALATALVEELLAAKKSVATAESCTGGWLAKCITDVAGSSECFGYGVVSYSNAAKTKLLNVDPTILDTDGAVSEATVVAMAEGALTLSGADFTVAISGVAGPGGGSAEKPVGTVWFAWALRDQAAPATLHRRLEGDRAAVRARSVQIALQGLRERLRDDD